MLNNIRKSIHEKSFSAHNGEIREHDISLLSF